MTGAVLGHAGATRAQRKSLGTPAAQAPDSLGLVQSGFRTEIQLVCEFRASHRLSAAQGGAVHLDLISSSVGWGNK